MSLGERTDPTRRERLALVAQQLGPYARPHRSRLGIALAASVAVAAAQLALPWPLRWVLDLVAGGSTPAAPSGLPGDPLVWPAVALVVVGTVLGGSEYVQRLAVAQYVVRTVNDARVGIVARHLDEAPPSGRARDPGDVVSRIVGDTARLRGGMKGALVHLLQHGLFLLGVSVVLLALDVWLGAAYLLGLGVAFAVAAVGADRAAALATGSRAREGRRVGRALEAAGTTGETWTAKPTDRERPTAFISEIKGHTAWVVQGLLALTACLVLTLAVEFTRAGRLGTGDLALVASYLLMLHYPTTRMGRQVTRLGPQLTSAERLAHLAPPRDRTGSS